MKRALLLATVAALLAPASALASPYSDAVTVSAPSGWWRLGDATGPGAAAAAGLSSGTWNGTVHLGAPGALAGDADTAATVSGSGWLSLGTTYAPAAAFTFEAWVDLATRSSTRYVLSKGTTSLGFHLYVSSGYPCMKVTTTSTTATLSAPTQLATGSWHHLAATFGGGIAALYVDGVAVTTRAVAGTLRTSALELTGGRYSGGWSSFFSGGLDELAVYDRALTGAEVAAHAAAGLAATPATVAIAGPPAVTDSRHAGFTVTGSDAQSAFTCALDRGGASACTGVPAWDSLPDGAHSLVVTPADRWGRTGTPSTYRWTIDQTVAPDWSPTAPDSTIAASVPASTAQTSATFTLAADRSGSTFTCALDSTTTFTTCPATVSYAALPAGAHVLRVKAADRFGHVEASASSFAWTIDHTPPDTAVVRLGAAPAGGDVAVFDSTEPGGRFECRFDTGAWSACASPVAVPAGTTTVAVRAIDAAGNTDPSPATAGAPRGGDAGTVEPTGAGAFTSSSAYIAFSAGGGASTDCRVDGGDWTACTSPVGLPDLAWGDHTWQLRATFPNGIHLLVPELHWTAAAPGARVAALQFPVLLRRSRDGRARSRGRVPTLRFALNVSVPVSVRVDSVRGRRTRALGTWTVPAAKPGDEVVRLPDNVLRSLRRGRYRIAAQPAGGTAARVAFAVV